MKKKILLGIITAISLISMILSGCGNASEKMNQGDFYYYYIDDSFQNRKDAPYVAILEVTEAGAEKEVLIIPETIDGKPVIGLGFAEPIIVGSNYYTFFTEKCIYKKLFIPKTIEGIVSRGFYTPQGAKCIICELGNLKVINELAWTSSQTYLSKPLYERFVAEYETSNYVKMANVEYIFDGEIFFVDDYDAGELIVTPPEPKKEGYAFCGWFKEPDLINEWDFNNDTIPQRQEDETGYLINITSLYAKWQNI